VGKPEIIGYQADPGNWSAPRLPEMTFDPDGVWVSGETGVRELVEDVDGFMRYHGYKRVYKPRNFRATARFGGYRFHCKECDTTTLTSGYLPHDFAELHAKQDHNWVGKSRDLVE
jgi:hypothetical protein